MEGVVDDDAQYKGLQKNWDKLGYNSYIYIYISFWLALLILYLYFGPILEFSFLHKVKKTLFSLYHKMSFSVPFNVLKYTRPTSGLYVISG